MYLLAQLKSQGLSRDAWHILFTAIVLSVITYALPSFAGQLSIGDKARLNTLFQRGVDFVAKPLVLTSSYQLEIKKIISQDGNVRHCLHLRIFILCYTNVIIVIISITYTAPKETHNKILNSFRSHGQNYVLPQTELTLFKNSFLSRCFLIFECFTACWTVITDIVCFVLFACFYCLLFMFILLCNVCCVWHAINKRQLTLTYFNTALLKRCASQLSAYGVTKYKLF